MSDLLLAKVLARMPVAKSAFDLAYEQGFRGTVRDWVNSLRGERGLQGLQGSIGKAGSEGPQGPRGATGPQGNPGPIGPMPEHEWRGTELRFQLTPDSWGPYVDLKGDSGKTSTSVGAVVVQGNSWYPGGWI